MIFMALLFWFPRIHGEIMLIAQRCEPSTAIGKNLKPLTPKNIHTKFNPLTEPNKEEQSQKQ